MNEVNQYDHHRDVYVCRDKKNTPVLYIMGEPCPRVFPHKLKGDCRSCAKQDNLSKRLAARIWQVTQNHYEGVPVTRRIKMACTTFINWIGSWSKN